LLPFADGFSLISKATGFNHLRTQMDRAVNNINNMQPVGAKKYIVYKQDDVNEFIKKDKEYSKKSIRQKRVLLIGASSFQLQLGAAMQRRLNKFENVKVHRFAKKSTGLNWPERVNWMKKTKELVNKFKPNILIMQFGGNDCVRTRNPFGPKKYEKFGTPLWDKIYMGKIKQLLDIFIKAGGMQVVIVGMPIMGKRKFSGRISYLNTVLERAANQYGAVFVPTWQVTADRKGKYRQYFTFNGKKRKLRTNDHIHLTRSGAKYVSAYIIEQIKKPLNLKVKGK